MSKKLYIILDGVSESVGDTTSLFKANKPTINLLASQGEVGFYLPEKRENETEPKTDLVVPLFFGMTKKMNPGRAALELYDLGIEIKSNSYCLAVKLSYSYYSAESETFLMYLNSLGGKYKIQIKKSEATNIGTRFLIANLESNSLNIFLTELKNSSELPYEIQDLNIVPVEIIECKNIHNSSIFLGWAKGALRGALKYLGFTCNPFNRDTNSLFDWITYRQNFDEWIVNQLNNNQKYETLVLYTKETAFASRVNLPSKKVEAIEFMDRNLSRVLSYITEDITVIILSDHSSNFNSTDNPIENTFFILSKIHYKKKNMFNNLYIENFSENSILLRNQTIIEQKELIKRIS